MRTYALIFVIILIQINTKGQNEIKIKKETDTFIVDVFMSLSTIGLTEETKKELITKGKIILDEETEKRIEIDSINNTIFIQSYFPGSMTSPCENYFLKSFVWKENEYKIVYSSYSTSFADKFQNQIEVYGYNKETKKLDKDFNDYNAFKLTIQDFFKPETAKSTLDKYSENIEPIYSLDDNRIICYISDTGYSNTLLSEPNLAGNTIEIEWNENTFIIKKIPLERKDNETEEI